MSAKDLQFAENKRWYTATVHGLKKKNTHTQNSYNYMSFINYNFSFSNFLLGITFCSKRDPRFLKLATIKSQLSHFSPLFKVWK